MKSVNHGRRQAGFFDLGMSLFVLVFASGMVYSAETAHAERVAMEEQIEAPAQASASAVLEQVTVQQ